MLKEDDMLTLLVIVLILSTTCVIFQDKVADFLLKYIFTEKRLKRIDGFLSGKELRKEAQEIDFVLNASASELKGRFQNICKKYGKRYQKKNSKTSVYAIIADCRARFL